VWGGGRAQPDKRGTTKAELDVENIYYRVKVTQTTPGSKIMKKKDLQASNHRQNLGGPKGMN